MEALLTLLTLLLTTLSLPSELNAECAASIEVPACDTASQQTLQLRNDLKAFKEQITSSLQKEVDTVQHLVETYIGGDPPTYSTVSQDEVASPYPGETRRLACNSQDGENNMLIGIHDNEKFIDLDHVRCVHYKSIQLGEQHTLDIPPHSNDFINCGPGEVVTGFGSSDIWVTFVVHVVCRNITSGASVTDYCQDVTVHDSDGSGEFVPSSWPVKCPGAAPEANVVTAVAYNQDTEPRWQKLRCCQLRRIIS